MQAENSEVFCAFMRVVACIDYSQGYGVKYYGKENSSLSFKNGYDGWKDQQWLHKCDTIATQHWNQWDMGEFRIGSILTLLCCCVLLSAASRYQWSNSCGNEPFWLLVFLKGDICFWWPPLCLSVTAECPPWPCVRGPGSLQGPVINPEHLVPPLAAHHYDQH